MEVQSKKTKTDPHIVCGASLGGMENAECFSDDISWQKGDATGPVHNPGGNLPNKGPLPKSSCSCGMIRKGRLRSNPHAAQSRGLFIFHVLRMAKRGVTSKCSRERIIVAFLSLEPV